MNLSGICIQFPLALNCSFNSFPQKKRLKPLFLWKLSRPKIALHKNE